jgi:hypothetical protein
MGNAIANLDLRTDEGKQEAALDKMWDWPKFHLAQPTVINGGRWLLDWRKWVG